MENLGDDAITVAALEHLAGTGLALDVVTDGDRPIGLPATAEWLGTLHEAVGGLRPADLEDDHRVAGAAARAQVGRLDHRPVEPGRYRAAVLLGGGSLTSLWGDGLVAPRAVLGSALRQAGVPYVLSGQGLGPLDDVDRALVDQLAEGARAVAARDARSAVGAGGAGHRRRRAPARGRAAGRDRDALPRAQPPRRRLRGRDRGRARALGGGGRCVRVRARAHRPRRALQRPARRGRGRHAARAGPHGVSAVGPVAGRGPRPGSPAGGRGAGRRRRGRHAPRTTPPCSGSAAGVPAVLGAGSPYYEAKAEGLRELVALPADLVVRPGAPLDLARRLPAVAEGLAGGGVARARAGVVAWWDATIGDLLAAGRASGGQRLSSSAAPTKGHTSGSTTGSSGWGRTA